MRIEYDRVSEDPEVRDAVAVYLQELAVVRRLIETENDRLGCDPDEREVEQGSLAGA